MSFNTGLDVTVDAFVGAVTDALLTATATLPARDPDELRLTVLTEAFELCCAFIDADGLPTDDELWALIHAFGTKMGPDLAQATPAHLRRVHTTDGRKKWALSTSDLFEILVGIDRREGTDLATTYYTHAMTLAHMVAALDTHTGRDELLALDAYRSLLLTQIKAVGTVTAPGPTPADRLATPAVTTAPVDSGAPPRPLDDLLAELDNLVGLAEVKREVRLVADLLQVQRIRRDRKLPVVESSRHLVFTGNPGTGKTTVARLLAQIYRTLGVVQRGHLIETDRAALVAGYVGQTAARVTTVFDEADEGVLLIDEAYALARGSDTDFGREAIDTIVKLVEDRRDRVVVIVAGYPDEMADFLDANPGLPSRFPRTIGFPDYTDDELVAIFESACFASGYRCDTEALEAVRASLAAEPRAKGFGNGRTVRNRFEQAIERQAGRVVAITDPTDAELTTLTVADVTGDEHP
jgi:energy-coupling factor transporter ATP-binding protein EcfA2